MNEIMCPEKYIDKRINWLDCAKAIAIIMVLLDHCHTILYSKFEIAEASYCSTSLFILLSGISVSIFHKKYKSYYRYNNFLRIRKLFTQYAVATLICTCFVNRFFDLRLYFYNICNFSAVDAYYYFVFLFQLMIISPYLIQWCKFCEKQNVEFMWHIGTLFILGFLAMISMKYTHILNVHGGGKFFGGVLTVCYIMLVFYYKKKIVLMEAKRKGQLLC